MRICIHGLRLIIITTLLDIRALYKIIITVTPIKQLLTFLQFSVAFSQFQVYSRFFRIHNWTKHTLSHAKVPLKKVVAFLFQKNSIFSLLHVYDDLLKCWY
jgi:hypothetical protein